MDYQNKSIEELEELVNLKDGEAVCELGERYLYGRDGCSVNYTRAYQLFHKGEKMNLARAYIGLGEMYRCGYRFAQNEIIAKEYYEKAGVSYPVEKASISTNSIKQIVEPTISPVNNSNSNVLIESDIDNMLNDAKRCRENEEYIRAENLCENIINKCKEVNIGNCMYQGNRSINSYFIEAQSLMAYISFNTQKFQDVELYANAPGVKEQYPWMVYLSTLCHKILNSNQTVLENDLKDLLSVSNRLDINDQQKSDILCMIGDLIVEGYGKNQSLNLKNAKDYFAMSSELGNAYAMEQLQNM